jgi:hypothetical protein
VAFILRGRITRCGEAHAHRTPRPAKHHGGTLGIVAPRRIIVAGNYYFAHDLRESYLREIGRS